MTDHDAPWRPPGEPEPTATPTQAGFPPPAPPAPTAAAGAQPPADGDPTLLGEPAEPGRNRSRVVVAVASLAAVAVLVVALVLVTRAGSDKAGASSPEDVAAGLFEALENEDLVALAELLHPGERRTLAEPGFEIIDELVRLELLDSSIDLSGLSGVDIEFEGLAYRVDPVPGADDLREIIVEEGTISASANGAELPIGKTLRDRFAEEIAELDTSGTSDIDQEATADFGPILVEDDGRWYLSVWYSVAEAARRSLDYPVPSLDQLPATIGAESPEAAIDAMIGVASGLDLSGIIGMLDPAEMAALYRYSPLFLEDAQNALDEVLAEFDASDITWSVSDIAYDTRTDGDVGYVTVTSVAANVRAEGLTVDVSYAPTAISVDVTSEGARYDIDLTIDDNVLTLAGDLDGEPLAAEITITDDAVVGWAEFDGGRVDGSLTVDPDGVCSRYELNFDGDVEAGCIEDEVPGASGVLAAGLANFEDFEFPTPTLVTTRTDGEWYFSPLLTLSNAALSYLRSTDAETVAMQLDQFEQLMASGF